MGPRGGHTAQVPAQKWRRHGHGLLRRSENCSRAYKVGSGWNPPVCCLVLGPTAAVTEALGHWRGLPSSTWVCGLRVSQAGGDSPRQGPHEAGEMTHWDLWTGERDLQEERAGHQKSDTTRLPDLPHLPVPVEDSRVPSHIFYHVLPSTGSRWTPAHLPM